jgi:ABC-type multidrug transport system permease subunit
VAQIINSTIGNMLSTFSGFTISPADIPSGWMFLYWLLPSHYSLEGMITTQWHGSKDTISFVHPATGATVEVPAWPFLQSFFGGKFDYSRRWSNVGVLIGFSAVTCVAFWASLRFRSSETR